MGILTPHQQDSKHPAFWHHGVDGPVHQLASDAQDTQYACVDGLHLEKLQGSV